MSADSSPTYHVLPDGDQLRVADANGRTIMVCNDTSSAEHYVVLLNEAYQMGYRSGYRDRKNTAANPS